MLYTIGHRKSYQQGLKEANIFRKLGKTKDYPGGIVFKNYDDAFKYLQDEKYLEEYGIYGLDADWKNDCLNISKYFKLLKNSSKIIDICSKQNISIITNFGCRTDCWYCIWKNHKLKNIQLETDWNKLNDFLNHFKYKKKVSISGGGDCLYKYSQYEKWWNKFFELSEKHNLLVDVHSREKFYNDSFWKKINKCVISSDILKDDIEYLQYLCKLTKVRITHVITQDSSIELIKEYIKFSEKYSCQFTIKELINYDDANKYQDIITEFPNIYKLDKGDYNIYYMPDNKITDKFL